MRYLPWNFSYSYISQAFYLKREVITGVPTNALNMIL